MKIAINMDSRLKGFTLIEMMVSITIFSIIIIIAFQALGNISILRSGISNKFDVNNELHFAVERLAALIKDGGDIDYEEYWNRRAVGTATISGHYTPFSGFGNYGSGGSFASNLYGSWLYYCVSPNGPSMGTGGCLGNTQSQRYGEYRQQFIDYNSNRNGDGGDEDGNGSITGDDDDEDLGAGPTVFTGWVAMKELYLIKKDPKPERLFFRWNVKLDPNAPTIATCNLTNATWSGCLGNIQILRLIGRDLGMDHTGSTSDSGEYDGLTDTWECRNDFNCLGSNNLPSGVDTEWVDLFPDYINVKNATFFPYPDKNFKYSWRESDPTKTINPYVRINLTLWLSWERQRKLKTPSGETTISTTVNLSK